MADTVVTFVVEKLAAMISEEANLLGGVGESLEYIKDELSTMNVFLEEAEENKERGKIKREWVKQVRELAYDAEDCIDEFKLRLEQPPEIGLMGGLHIGAGMLKKFIARRWVATEIERIKIKAKEASERAEKYGFITANPGSSSGSSTSQWNHDPRQDALFAEDADLVGIDKPRDEIIGWLLDEEVQFRVISVVGTGGLGKTTLIKRVYECSSVNSVYFGCCIWMTVSESFERKEFLSKMFRKLFSSSNDVANKMDEVELSEKIRNYLRETRYAIVLDDIWTIAAWQSIKLVLPSNHNGSRVMVTTRFENVANTCSHQNHKFVYKLKPLTSEQSWDLFCKRVFSRRGALPDLQELSRKILRKCSGLPLAIETIGGLLASKPNKTRQEWQNLLDHLGSELETNPSLKPMNIIMALSFNDLPYDLKRCFLYLSIFPEDYLIQPKRLQRLWVAEGFIRGRHDMSMEDVAESYFNELVNRNMIHPDEISVTGKVKFCRVHDIMLEFIISKATEENLVTVHRRPNRTLQSQGVIRRLAIHTYSSLEEITKSKCLDHVRSVIAFGYTNLEIVFPQLKFLRVLDMQESSDLHIDIPKSHLLKYLNLRDASIDLHFGPFNIPNLQMLDLRGVWGGSDRQWWSESKPQQLRHLHDDNLLISQRIGNFIAIQTLSILDLGHSQRSVVGELGNLTQLRKLGVRGLTEENGMEFCASLEKLSSCLRSLYAASALSTDPDSIYMRTPLTFLESLTSPPLLIQNLRLSGLLGKLPGWVGRLENVTKITLFETGLDSDSIRALEILPKLVKLKLLGNSYSQNKLCFSPRGFQSLKLLIVFQLPYLEWLVVEDGAMPNVEILNINECISLRKVSNFVNEHHPNLKEVFIASPYQEVITMLQMAAKSHSNRPTFEWVIEDPPTPK